MIQQVIMYEAVCDCCGKTWNDGNGCVAYNNRFDLLYAIQESEWIKAEPCQDSDANTGRLAPPQMVKSTKVYCPDCYFLNEEDEYEIIKKNKSHEAI